MRSRPVLDAVEIPAFDRADLLDELSNEDGFHPVLLGERPNVGQSIGLNPHPWRWRSNQPVERQRFFNRFGRQWRAKATCPTTPKDSASSVMSHRRDCISL